MPLADLLFCLKPISEVPPMFATTLKPKIICSLGNLLFKAEDFVNLENQFGSVCITLFFHKSAGWLLVNSKGEAVTTQAKESSVLIACPFRSR